MISFLSKLWYRINSTNNGYPYKPAKGDYYFSFSIENLNTRKAKALIMDGYEKPVPYHYVVEVGKAAENGSDFMVHSSGWSHSKAYEYGGLEYAPTGALDDIYEYFKTAKQLVNKAIDVKLGSSSKSIATNTTTVYLHNQHGTAIECAPLLVESVPSKGDFISLELECEDIPEIEVLKVVHTISLSEAGNSGKVMWVTLLLGTDKVRFKNE